ncbi:MAG TPA: hypothetical protein VG755_25980, partial [Nannocystaceae bacterium]|nr:hypothetical protein [Nannocystaceae bacterium]
MSASSAALLFALAIVSGCRPSPQHTRGQRAAVVAFDPDPAMNGVLPPEQIEPPPDGWWEAERPCPLGTALVEFEGHAPDRDRPGTFAFPSIECRRPDGTKHGPSTTFNLGGEPMRTGYYRNGFKHGREQTFTPYDELSQVYYDEGVGIGTWRTGTADKVTVSEHRGEGQIYVTRHEHGRVVEEGLYLDGLRHGRWAYADGAQDRVVEFEHGLADGNTLLSPIPECDAFARRWHRCLLGKHGGERYEMATVLSVFIHIWEMPALPNEAPI